MRTRLAVVGALAFAARLATVVATPGYRPIHDDASYARVAATLLALGRYPGHHLPGGGWQVSAFRPAGWAGALGAAWEVLGSGGGGPRLLEGGVGAVGAVVVAVLRGQIFDGAAAL